MFELLMNYIKARLVEKTTWLGIATLIADQFGLSEEVVGPMANIGIELGAVALIVIPGFGGASQADTDNVVDITHAGGGEPRP